MYVNTPEKRFKKLITKSANKNIGKKKISNQTKASIEGERKPTHKYVYKPVLNKQVSKYHARLVL